MKPGISVIIITKNAEMTIRKTLRSVKGWTNEIIIIDDYSNDKTIEIAKSYKVKIFYLKYQGEGKQRNYALSLASQDWVLVLDADEEVPFKLKQELLKTIKSTKYSGFYIPIQSHYKNKKLYYGGENYKKMIFFKRRLGYSTSDEIHAVCKVRNNNVSELKNKLNHFSYLSIRQTITKFTNYSKRVANQKFIKGERSNLEKLFIYPFHMLYARFIKDKGYKDGLFRLPLDLAFAYMEFLIYFILFFKRK